MTKVNSAHGSGRPAPIRTRATAKEAGRDPDLWLGTARIEPKGDVEAGAYGTWRITYRVGRYGIDNSGAVRVAIRDMSDWGRPQFDDPAADGYVTIAHTGAAKLRVRYEPRGGVRPSRKVIAIEVYDGSLAAGSLVTLTWGDRSGGSRGSRAQSFCDDRFEFSTLVDCFGTGVYEPLPTSPTLRIVPSRAARLVAIAPSNALVGARTSLVVVAEDRWGNPATDYRGRIRVSGADGGPTTYRFIRSDRGAHRLNDVVFHAAGDRKLAVADGSGLTAVSNPVLVAQRGPEYRLLWGDTQAQSGATVGTGSVEAFFRFARDVAGLDFIAHSANDFQIEPAHWRETRAAVRRFHEPGRFVPFLSFEWSGNTPAGGDHNVIYLGDDGPLHRSSHWLLRDRREEHLDRYPVRELWRALRGRGDVIAIPHIGGRRADLDHIDPRLCPVLEICSVHGHFEWFARDALRRGLTVGFVGATDDHSGRPGASYPTADGHFPVKGGLAGVYAAATTRAAIFEALRARRCYATTGSRIVLEVTADGHRMGEAYRAVRAPTVRVRARGTGPLERVDILRGEQVVYAHTVAKPGRRLRIAWMGARTDTRGRQTRWNGGLVLSEGRIVEAQPWTIDNPADWVRKTSEREVRWSSTTAGNPNGVVLDLDAPETAEIAFRTDPATFSFRPADVSDRPLAIACGGLEQQVVVDRAPESDGTDAIEFTWQDPEPQPGRNAYWVRVVQLDGAKAWSSPIFVRLASTHPRLAQGRTRPSVPSRT